MTTDRDQPEDVICRWCGEHSGPRCPWVKALEFDFTGQVTRVEFITPADCAPRRPTEDPEPDYPRIQPKV